LGHKVPIKTHVVSFADSTIIPTLNTYTYSIANDCRPIRTLDLITLKGHKNKLFRETNVSISVFTGKPTRHDYENTIMVFAIFFLSARHYREAQRIADP